VSDNRTKAEIARDIRHALVEEYPYIGDDNAKAYLMHEADAIIQAHLPDTDAQRWISTNDQLPEDTEGELVPTISASGYLAYASFNGHEWYWEGVEEGQGYIVKWWMPAHLLPAPPEEP